MRPEPVAWRLGAAFALVAAFGSAALGAPRAQLTVLEVPYIAQGPELCGGAAAAMVLRYWGARRVQDTDFAHLVDPARAGIPAADLVASLRARDYEVLLPEGSLGTLREAIAAGRPALVLLRIAENLYHYVVVVAVSDDFVLYHDPADAPYRVVEVAEFERRWEGAQRWLGIPVPTRAAREVEPVVAAPVTGAPESCRPWMDEGLRLAASGARDAARTAFAAASSLCPDAGAPWRELAGLAALDEQWATAVDHARVATERDPGDGHAVQILATSLFLDAQPSAALSVWNRIGQPEIDRIVTTGGERIRRPVIDRRVGLRAGELLTPFGIGRAERRLAALPAATSTRVAYTPLGAGLAEVLAAVRTRPRPALGWPLLARTAGEAVAERRFRLRLASLTGGGDQLEASWRWEANRPRVAVSLAAPDVAGIPGVADLGIEWAEETYGVDDGVERDERRRARFAWSRWINATVRLGARLDVDRWASRGTDWILGGEAVYADPDERWRLRMGGAVAANAAANPGYSAWDVSANWRSGPADARAGIVAHLLFAEVGRSAPRGVWPGAGAARGRSGLIRAHPLLVDGVIQGPVFGRSTFSANVEASGYLRSAPVGLAVFVDIGHATRTPEPTPWLVDAGLGLRLRLPGADQALRLDWAHGLRDDASAWSVGWTRSWQ